MNVLGLADSDLECVVDTFPEGLMLIDERGAVLYANLEASRLLGAPALRPAECPPELDELEPTGQLIWRRVRPLLDDAMSAQRLRLEREPACALRIAVRQVFEARYAISVREEVPRNARQMPAGFARALDRPLPPEPASLHWPEPLTLAHMECFLDSLPSGVLVADRQGELRWLNRAAANLLDGTGPRQELARAARHVAAGAVAATARFRLESVGGPLRVLIWRAGAELAGIRLHREQPRAEPVAAWRER